MEEPGNKFMNKWGFLIVIVGLFLILFVLKLLGFPEFLYK